MQLYTYFCSSAAWRVRIALALKGRSPAQRFIHLLKDGGQQNTAAFRGNRPLGVVPVLESGDGSVLTQSVACDIHPLTNLRVRRYAEHAMAQACVSR